MARLGDTVATLKRMRRLAAAGEAARATAGGPGMGGRMRETTSFGANPGQLRMLSYVPQGATALVVVLHGCTQGAEAYAAGAGWLTLAERFGFAVLAPEQTPGNNPNRCFNWFQPEDTRRGGGEAASIAAMVNRLTAEGGLDPGRVFVTGLSAGGAMASVMLATYPELFAGGGIVAGLPHGAASTMPEAFEAMGHPRARTGPAWGDEVRQASGHRGRWPTVSVWHGGADRTVAPINADAIVSQWLDVHGLSGPPHQEASAGIWTRQVWTDAAGQPAVELHRLAGLGHGTPLATLGADGVGTVGAFLLEAGVSSSLEMARGWGLIDVVRSTARDVATAHAAEPKRERVDAVFTADAPAQTDVAAIINRALAAAGLLK